MTIVAADTRFIEHVKQVIIEGDKTSEPDVPAIDVHRKNHRSNISRITVKGIPNGG